MDEFPHCRVVSAVSPEAVEVPMFTPTYVALHGGTDVLVVAAPGLAVAASELASGAKVLTVFLYALADDDTPQDEHFGMGHNMTVETARNVATSILALCDAAEADAARQASAAIANARGR